MQRARVASTIREWRLMIMLLISVAQASTALNDDDPFNQIPVLNFTPRSQSADAAPALAPDQWMPMTPVAESALNPRAPTPTPTPTPMPIPKTPSSNRPIQTPPPPPAPAPTTTLQPKLTPASTAAAAPMPTSLPSPNSNPEIVPTMPPLPTPMPTTTPPSTSSSLPISSTTSTPPSASHTTSANNDSHCTGSNASNAICTPAPNLASERESAVTAATAEPVTDAQCTTGNADGDRAVSVLGRGTFCAFSPICAGTLMGNCPALQRGLQANSVCAMIDRGIYGCMP